MQASADRSAADVRASARAAFSYPDFTAFSIARFCIVAALEMQSVAVGWQVYEITKRPLDLGLIGLAQFLPGIALFLPAGHVTTSSSQSTSKLPLSKPSPAHPSR